MMELDEANRRKWTYNMCVFVISLVFIAASAIEYNLDLLMGKEHLVFEALGLIVLCLIYFSTIVDLIRKLRIFVLEQTKLEGILIKIQFIIFFIAYGSKVICILYWIKNPPKSQYELERFLVNSDLMSLVWIFVPILFVLWMQTRSFKLMTQEKLQLLLNADKQLNLSKHDDDVMLINRSGLTP